MLPCLIAFLIAELAFALPAMAQSTSDSLCYLETESGEIIDLSEFCEESGSGLTPVDPASRPQQPATTGLGQTYPTYTGPNGEAYAQAVSYPEPPNVYDYGAMQEFDRQLYGD